MTWPVWSSCPEIEFPLRSLQFAGLGLKAPKCVFPAWRVVVRNPVSSLAQVWVRLAAQSRIALSTFILASDVPQFAFNDETSG